MSDTEKMVSIEVTHDQLVLLEILAEHVALVEKMKRGLPMSMTDQIKVGMYIQIANAAINVVGSENCIKLWENIVKRHMEFHDGEKVENFLEELKRS